MIELRITAYSNDKARQRAKEYYYQHHADILLKRKATNKRAMSGSVVRRARWKAAIFALLGNQCIRCGFSDQRALQLDHIHGGGSRERSRNSRCMAGYYRLLALSPELREGIQLLCANCNWIKRSENSELNQHDFYKEAV